MSNKQPPNNFGQHEKAPVGRRGNDRAVMVQAQGDWLCGELRSSEEEELQLKRKKLLPPRWKRY